MSRVGEVKKFGKCDICKKKLNGNDYYKLCRKCQPSWKKGFEDGQNDIKGRVYGVLSKP